jgi:hypothetical protein
MVSRVRARLTYANVLATLAVFIALGAGSYAAINVPKKSVGTKQLKRNSVTSPKVKPRSLRLSDFKPSERSKLTGAPGPAGPAGERGPAGAALTCPSGTALHELACIELEARPQADWYDAFDACDQAQRRLVTLAELQTFRSRTDLNPPTAGSEWVDGGLSDDGAQPREAIYLTLNLGIPDLAPITSSIPYRCVVPATIG